VLAFDAFARAAVEIAVLEVGLGGRLDATSVATPIVTAVTTIGYDHQEYLGDTLTAIAREKAGVMRPGVPVVIGPVPPPAARILLSHARTVGSSVAQYGRDYRVCGCDAVRFDVVTGSRHWSDLTLKLRGTFQRTNAATALMLLELARASHPVPSEAVRRALDDVFWPGRLDVVLETPQVILDGAHNPEAARALARELAPVAADRCVRLVFGAMRDKNWLDMWEALRPLVHEVILTQPSLPRSRSPETLARVIREDGIPVRVVPGPQEAVAAALASSSCDDLIVVTGSLFLVGDVYPFFLRQQGRRHLFEPWHDEAADGTEARG
jgi:dihydrofolate synthase/folylpolyglutamate synthase